MQTTGTNDGAFAEWRSRVLVAAGLDSLLAATIAGRPGFDLHALLELIDRGCPPHLAARILAPLDDELPLDALPDER